MDKHLIVVLFHLFFVSALFLWVGFNRAATPDWLYNVLFAMGIVVLFYHGFKAISRIGAKSPYLWINLMHVFLIAPLLIWIGFQGKKTDRSFYDMLLLAGFAVFGFHIYHAIMLAQTFVKPTEM